MSGNAAFEDSNETRSRLGAALRSVSPTARSIGESINSFKSDFRSAKRWKHSEWRHTLGIVLLLITVFLWTASNFLASTIFADNTYSKPYFVTYINSTFFVAQLFPILLHKVRTNPAEFAEVRDWIKNIRRSTRGYERVGDSGEEDAFLKPDQAERGYNVATTTTPPYADEMEGSMELQNSHLLGSRQLSVQGTEKLSLLATAKLSFEFCLLWFLANYFTSACLEYTTVASSTILTSTSSIWTLLCGTAVGVERFTYKKLLGVLASLAGIVLISSVDISGKSDENRGSFPHKTPREIGLGDALAFLSAVLYGFYTVLMKKRIGDESRVNMPLFFGLVGLLNTLLLWPGFIVLHLTRIETFELPPDARVLAIIVVNSTASLVSDFCWAYSMLLTSPLVTTVGLSMTIPLSLIGQMILDNQYSSATYWFGACVVVLSFIIVNREEVKDEEEAVLQEETNEEAALPEGD